MATLLYLRDTSATGVKPTTKQSADTISRDVASTYATYAAPAMLDRTPGPTTRTSTTTAAEPGVAHYTHYGTWLSPIIKGTQSISGTFTLNLGLREGNAACNCNPRIYMYVWLANNTKGSDIQVLTTSATEVSGTTSYPGSCQTFFSAVALSTVTLNDGDRIVVEIESYDNTTGTTSYYHGIQFNGTSGSTNGSVSFSTDLIFYGDDLGVTTKTKALAYKVLTSHQIQSVGGYAKYKTVPVNGSNDGAQTSYVKHITVIKGAGTDSGETVYIADADTLNWPYDIRFYNGTTNLPFYRNKQILASATTQEFYVLVDSIPSGTGNSMTLTMKYGLAGASDAGDGASTFLFFDDYDDATLDTTNKYDVTGTPTATLTGGVLDLTMPASGNHHIQSKNAYGPYNLALEAYVKDIGQNVQHGFGLDTADGSINEVMRGQYSSSSATMVTANGTAYAFNGNDTNDTTNYHRWTVYWMAAGCGMLKDGVNVGATTTYIPSIATKLGYGSNASASEHTLFAFIGLRKFTTNEPQFGTWSAAQSSGGVAGKSLAYNIRSTPAAKTKTLAYTIATSGTTTHSATRSLAYKVRSTHSAITKTLAYSISDGAVHRKLTKMLRYDIAGQTAHQYPYSKYTGNGVKVAVLDTGIDMTHPDLAEKTIIWKDYVNSQSTPYDDGADIGHGTMTAGIIGGMGRRDNGQYLGMAPGATLCIIKIAAEGDFSPTQIHDAIEWAIGQGVKVFSCSFGNAATDTTLQTYMQDCYNNRGITFVFSIGNDGSTCLFPGNMPEVICVGAVQSNNTIESYSGRGPGIGGVNKPDVVGWDLVETLIANGNDWIYPLDAYYGWYPGTSFSTPQVAALCALLLEANPSLTPAQIKNIVNSTATQLGTPLPNNTYGYGRINVSAAITMALSSGTTTHSATKSMAYKIQGTPAAKTRVLQYTIKTVPAAKTRSLAYKVKSTPSAKTKSLVYAVRSTHSSITKSLLYAIRSTHATLTKTLAYVIAGQGGSTHSVQKTLAYQVRYTHAALTRSLAYKIRTTTIAQRTLAYNIRSTPAAKTRTLSYTIAGQGTASHDLTRSLRYAIKGTQSTTRPMKYVIVRSVQTTRAMRYAVKAGHNTTRQLRYTIAGEIVAETVTLSDYLRPVSLNDYSRPVSLSDYLRPVSLTVVQRNVTLTTRQRDVKLEVIN